MTDKISKWDKAETIIQIFILIFAIVALHFSIGAADRANNLTQQTLEIQDKLENYPMKAFHSSSFAMAYGSYVNGSTQPVIAEGFLDATIIIISPHVIKLTIENVEVQPISKLVSDFTFNSTGVLIDTTLLPEFDYEKFNQWSFYFETENPMRRYPYPSYQNNFTYYTRPGVNYVNVSVPFSASFYLNPQHSFETVAQNITPIDLGIITVYVKTTDMQTEEMTPVPMNFTTSIGVQVKILEP